MLEAVQDFSSYIRELCGIDAELRHLHVRLPAFFRSRYALYKIMLPDGEFTGVFVQMPDDFTPGAFERHMRQLPPDRLQHYVVVSGMLPSYVRTRLVKRHIPFVVPRVQLFWPELGVAARARVQRPTEREVKHLSPAAQVTLIHASAGKLGQGLISREMAELLGYTPMTMTRVLDEFAALGLGKSRHVGRTRKFKFAAEGKELWDLAKPHLRNPVLQKHVVPLAVVESLNPLLGGESALAARTMLSPPYKPVYAVGINVWKKLRNELDLQEHPEDNDVCDLQVWAYNPFYLDEKSCVDPYSLALSLEKEEDERVNMAVDNMLERLS